MKYKLAEMITPDPYFKISFGCGNRAFYGVKEELYEIAEKIGIEIQDGYISEKCDYEGDLEKIIIYHGDRSKALINSVLSHYKIPATNVPSDVNVVLSIF